MIGRERRRRSQHRYARAIEPDAPHHEVLETGLPPEGEGQRPSIWSTAALTASGAAILLALCLRAWTVGHWVLNSDQAVTGLMAQDALGWHFHAFFPGQSYGGVEPYLVAPFFALLPDRTWSLNGAAMAISIVGLAFLWLSARRLLGSRPLAAGVAALCSLFPTATLLVLSQAFGFRTTTYLLSFVLLYVSILVWEAPSRLWRWGLLGLVAGLGWWSSPEIAYFGVAAGTTVLLALWRDRHRGLWRRSALLVGGVMIGSAPWWWAWLVDGAEPFRNASDLTVPFGSKLDVFFSHVLPQLFGLQRVYSGEGFLIGSRGGSHALAVVAICIVLVLSSLAAIRRRGPGIGLGIAVLASPFAYAASPAAWFWQDGRYAVILLPLYVLVLAIGLEQLIGWRRLPLAEGRRSSLLGGSVALVLGLSCWWSVAQFSWWAHHENVVRAGWLSGWDGSDQGYISIAEDLASRGYDVGWADYWLAYRLDFDGAGSLRFSPAPNNSARIDRITAAATRSPRSVWLVQGAAAQDGRQPRGRAGAPGGLRWGELRARIEARGASWSAVRIARLPQAMIYHEVKRHPHHHRRHPPYLWVIRTQPTVTPAQLGLEAPPRR